VASLLTAPNIAAVAIGGAVGSVARLLLTVAAQPAESTFPFGTYAVNIAGCIILGVLLQVAAGRFSDPVKFLMTTGFCGGFTTFSTFSYESFRLMQTGLWLRAATNIVASVVGGLVAIWIGILIGRAVTGEIATR
jgi:fluoride exporter